MRTKLLIVWPVLLGMLPLMMAACQPGTANPSPDTGTATVLPISSRLPTPSPMPGVTPTIPSPASAITITFLEEPDTLNPLYTQNWFAWLTWDLILSPLWFVDDHGVITPELAGEIPSLANGGLSPDGRRIIVRLRQEAAWSDGRPVTADDLVFTYDMMRDPANQVVDRFPFETGSSNLIQRIIALDKKTAQIELTRAYPDWMFAFFVRDLRILPSHILRPFRDQEGSLDNAPWNRLPYVTNGPYRVTDWQEGESIQLLANPAYWRGNPKIQRIGIRFISQDDTAQPGVAVLDSLLSGDSDLGVGFSLSDFSQVWSRGSSRSDQVRLVSAFSGNFDALFLNCSPETAHPAMSDVRVRQAIALSLHRQVMIDRLLADNGLAYNPGFEIPASLWHDTPYDDPDIRPWKPDPDRARALLDEAGWKDLDGDGQREKDGHKLELRYATLTDNPIRDQEIHLIQQGLAEVGIQLIIQNYPAEVFFASYPENGPIATGQYDLAQWTDGLWYFPAPDTPLFQCNQIPSDEQPEGFNWFGVCDPQMDDLFLQVTDINAQVSPVDQITRVKAYHNIIKIMVDQMYWIPLRTDPDLWFISNRLENVRISGIHPFWNSYNWQIR